MKKNLCKALLLGVSLLPLSVLAQENLPEKSSYFPKLFPLNKSVSIGLIGGVMDNFSFGAMGLNASFYGFYADFMGWPRKHYDDIRIDRWEDSKVFAWHAGYQIPFHCYDKGSIRLIPLFGYAKIEHGITDGSDWTVGDSGIINNFETTEVKKGFDYGTAIAFQNYDRKIGYFNFYVAYTRYTAWIGFGIDFSLRNLK